MADFVSSVPVPTISVTGCFVPDFASIRAGLVADFKGIYGQDVVLDNSTQDGQWLGLLATALKNYSDAFLSCYNAFSPVTAQGAGLSSIVKVNGIARDAASYSTVDIVNIGQAGRTITNPQIRDNLGNLWILPDFTIPFSGTITVTAICATIGAVPAAAGGASPTFWQIATPQLGWQSVSNPAAAALGAPVESDADLRRRQALSTALPSQTVLDGIVAAILSLPGVVSCKPYENDDDTVDANGIPPHGTAFVVDGGDAQAIAEVIALRKTDGSPTYGTSTQTVLTGKAQIPRGVRFFRPIRPQVTYLITLEPLAGYTADARIALQQAVSDWTNAQGDGGAISIKDVYEPALGVRIGGIRPYKILSIKAARGGAVPQDADVPMAFNEAPLCVPANVNVSPS